MPNWWETNGFDPGQMNESQTNWSAPIQAQTNLSDGATPFTNAAGPDPSMAGGAPAAGGEQGTIEQLKQLIGSAWDTPHLQQLLPQIQAMGWKVQNQARGDLRPRFLSPTGETFDFGPGGWVSHGNIGNWDAAGEGGAPGSGAPAGSLRGLAYGNPGDFLRNTPGYQFNMEEGLKGVQRSAAAKGTLLTGGTVKGLMQYGQGVADSNLGNWWDRYSKLANMGLSAANQGYGA